MNTAAHYVAVSNNTIVFRGELPANWALLVGAFALDSLYFYNNIATGVRPQIWIQGEVKPSAHINIYHNCFYSILPWDTTQIAPPGAFIPLPAHYDTIANNLFADPLLIDPWSGNLELQFGSPCIDAGVPWLLDKDGTRSDMGAFGGPAGGFYIYQDLPPSIPSDFAGERESSQVVLQWKPNTEADVEYYAIYRTSQLPVVALPENMIAQVNFDYSSVPDWSEIDSVFVQYVDNSISSGASYHYAIAAIDSSLLSSLLSPPISFIGTGIEGEIDHSLPDQFILEQNYPNPFNATTAIVYKLPNIGAQPAEVKLIIYNSLGQEVRTLVKQPQFPGRQVAYWDGLDNSGNAVSSGVYFYKLQISGVDFIKSKKMVLLK